MSTVSNSATRGVHEWIDEGFARSMRQKLRLYADGFGDTARLDRLVSAVAAMQPAPAPALDIEFGRPKRWPFATIRTGRFTSPAAPHLPPESRDGEFEEWLPRPDSPVALILATTGEEGAGARRGTAALFARHGIGSLILENPFYGTRRPRGQIGPALRTVADQFAMNLSTVLEACALLRTYHEAGHVVGVTGYSQGGMMAAFATALSPFAVASSPRGAGRSAQPVFTSHALTKTMRWDVLAREAGSFEAAKTQFDAALGQVHLDRVPPPHDPSCAILVAARRDAFIPIDEVRALHERWAGAELRWVRGGHVTGLVLQHAVHRRAMLDAFARHPGR